MSYIILLADFTSFICLTNLFSKTLLNTYRCQVLSQATEHSSEQNRQKSPAHVQLQLMMSSSFNIYRVGISFVMMCIFYKSAVDSLSELSPQKYFSTLQPGKASLAYFCQAGKYFLYSDVIFVMFLLLFNQQYCWDTVKISIMCYKAVTKIYMPEFKP